MKSKILSWFAHVSVQYYQTVLLVGLGLTIACGILSEQLVIKANMKDLMPQDHPMVKGYNEKTEDFEAASNVIIAAIGETDDLKRFADEVVPQIEKLDQYIYRVSYKVNRDFLKKHGLMLVKTKNLKTAVSSYEQLGLEGYIGGINDNFEETYIADNEGVSSSERENNAIRALDGIKVWLETMHDFLTATDTTEANARIAVDNMLLGEQYMMSPKKDMLVITAFPKFTTDDIDRSTELINELNDVIKWVAYDYDGIEKVGIAGAMALIVEENEALSEDSSFTSLLAFVLIIVTFIFSFRMWSSPLLAGLSLIAGIIWTTGLATLAVGHLNIMTSIFGVILIGLGIDFNIHVISGYLENRSAGLKSADAMKTTFDKAGGGILVGALTTSLAFFSLMVTQNAGMKEFGLISGAGVLFTMLSSFTILPAMLAFLDKARIRQIVGLQRRLTYLSPLDPMYERLVRKMEAKMQKQQKPKTPSFGMLGDLSEKIKRRPIVYLSLALALTVVTIFKGKEVEFNYDFMSLEPPGLTSVALQDSLIEKFNMSPDIVFVSAETVEQSRLIAEEAKDVPRIGLTSSISDFVPSPAQHAERVPYLSQIRTYLNENKAQAISNNDVQQLINQLYRLEDNVIELAQMAFTGGQDRLDDKAREIIGDPNASPKDRKRLVLELTRLIEQDPEAAVTACNLFQRHYEPYLRSTALSMSSTDRVTLEDVPEDILSQFLSKDGSEFLVTMFPKEQIWNLNFLEHFSAQMEQIDPQITGTPIIYYILIMLIGKDGSIAAVLTLIIVLILL
ncbi:MAG: MMPL family transporter, partial [Bacteroidota bacterium]